MTAAAQPLGRARALRPSEAPSAKWTIAFLLVPMICQLLLLLPGIGSVRVVIRSFAFVNGLLYLTLLPGRARWHPASSYLLGALFIVGLSFFHPTTNSTLSGVAHVLFYAAIASPIFWVSRMRIEAADLRRMIQFLWGFHTLSSFFGALQVFFPGRFEPAAADILPKWYVAALQVTLANGDHILRPMGLSDTPGGAGIAGFYAALLGIGLFMESRGLMRVLNAASALLGIFVIYLCQVRSSLVLLAVCLISMAAIFTWLGKAARGITVLSLVTAAAIAAFFVALQVGGEHTFDRLGLLLSDDPGSVYQANRGNILTASFSDLLPRYPLGAGLGRWGMIASYFADTADPDRLPIWCELQWTGWILDGGVPLLIVYPLAVLSTTLLVFRVLDQRAPEWAPLQSWGVLLLGYNVGAIALTFSFPVFMAPLGQEFWLLNAAFFTAAITTAKARPA